MFQVGDIIAVSGIAEKFDAENRSMGEQDGIPLAVVVQTPPDAPARHIWFRDLSSPAAELLGFCEPKDATLKRSVA